MSEPTRRGYGPQGCAERSAQLLLAAVLAAVAACAPVDVPAPTEPARTVSVPVPALEATR